MIGMQEVIIQDQLKRSSNPGKVNVVYPRGSTYHLSVNIDDPNPTPVIDKTGSDGAYQQFDVLPNGNLKIQGDRPTSVGYVILGANLVYPTS